MPQCIVDIITQFSEQPTFKCKILCTSSQCLMRIASTHHYSGGYVTAIVQEVDDLTCCIVSCHCSVTAAASYAQLTA